MPPLWENDASAYFSTIELMSQEANMTSERSRYLALVTTLSRDASVFKSVVNLLKTTNTIKPYLTLKVAILRLYSNAGGEDLETSLNDCVRGDDKVSYYLARLRSIFASRYCEPTTLQEDILKSRVVQSVDTPTRLALYSYEQSTVDELAAHANRLSLAKSQPTTPMSKVNITSTKPQYKINEYFDKQLENMSDAVDELNRKLEKFTSYQRNKGSAPISTISKNELCFYHNRYGNRAHKCLSPCSWHANDSMSHTGSSCSVIPLNPNSRDHPQDYLSAVNGSSVPTFGCKNITIDLGGPVPLNWEFCIAETLKPLIGIDFLSHFDIKIDPRKGRLIFPEHIPQSANIKSFCWFHQRFGPHAQKCRDPCSFFI